MTDPAPSIDRVFELAASICDGRASPSEYAELDSLLLDDLAAFNRYLRYCRMHSALRLELRAHRATQAACRQLGIQPAGTESGELHAAPTGVPASGAAPGVPVSSFGFGSAWSSSGWPLAYLIATVLITTGMFLGSLVSLQPLDAPKSTSSWAGNSVSRQTGVSFVGRITGMVDCRWAHEKTIVPGLVAVPLGQTCALTSGLLEITYDTGAKVILQGPCTYEVNSATGGHLSVGKLVARVEKKAESRESRAESTNQPSPNPKSKIQNPLLPPLDSQLFTVTTPTATVTDLGTEFGVQVDDSGATHASVFVGTVKLQPIASDDREQGQAVLLGANESACAQRMADADSGQPPVVVRPATASPTAFIRTMPASTAAPCSADAYAELVLSMHPAAYYRMKPPVNDNDRDIVFDSAGGGHHGVLDFSNQFVGSPYVTGRYGHALLFRGAMADDRVVVPNYPIATNNELSVSAWVQATLRTTWGAVAATWGHQPTGQFFLGFYKNDGNMAAGLIQADGKEVWARQPGPDHSFPCGKWQHVAFSTDGKLLRLYLNGMEVGSCPHDGILLNPPQTRLVIGGAVEDNVSKSEPKTFFCHWNGRIDELAVFNHTLAAEDIATLYSGKHNSPERHISGASEETD